MRYIALIIILSVLFSCDDFLEQNPTGVLTSESKLSSPESALAFTNSAYDNITVSNSAAGLWGGFTPLLLEYMTGKSTSENSQSLFKEFQDLNLSARSPYIEQWWQGCYAGIAKCNLALSKLDEFDHLDQELISNYKSEVLYLRAQYYFYLVRLFGDVPKVKNVQTELGDLQLTRSPLKEIYDEIIIPDLLEAEKSSLPFKDETGRVSMGAIKTLLADVYLTYAGYPVQGGAEYYEESAQRSLDVINSGVYSLFQSYDEFRNPSNNNSTEFIFQTQYTVNLRSNQMVSTVLPSRSGMSAFGLEYGSLIPSDDFVKSYASGDLRAEEKQFFFRTYKGHPSKFSEGAPELEFIDFNAFYIHKFFDQQAIDVAGQSGLNWTIYRYADVLLMYAEAQVMADGTPNQQAFDAVNEVRSRANLDPVSTMDLDAFRKAVWDERYFELCYENKTWFDIIRTRLIRDDKSGTYMNFEGYVNIYGKAYSQKHLLFPIPLREMQTNFNLSQNFGY
ncbi:MAG: RagB/SusD family nutrient uptake outer membrane protein [Cyclobacteriaceae bacterium]